MLLWTNYRTASCVNASIIVAEGIAPFQSSLHEHSLEFSISGYKHHPNGNRSLAASAPLTGDAQHFLLHLLRASIVVSITDTTILLLILNLSSY